MISELEEKLTTLKADIELIGKRRLQRIFSMSENDRNASLKETAEHYAADQALILAAAFVRVFYNQCFIWRMISVCEVCNEIKSLLEGNQLAAAECWNCYMQRMQAEEAF